MVSKIVLEFSPSFDDRFTFNPRYKSRNSKRPESRIRTAMSATPRSIESSNVSPTRKANKILEVRKVPHLSSYTKPKNNSDSHSQHTLNAKPPVFKAIKRNSSISPRKKKPPISQAFPKLDLEPVPIYPGKDYYSERLWWNKRKSGNLPICIVNFNGILGDYAKNNFWSNEEGKFSLAEGVTPGLRFLTAEFYIVIVSWYSRELSRQVIGLCEDGVLIADAVYLVRHRRLKHRFRHDYSLIYKDFEIGNVSQQAAIVTALLCSRESIKERKGCDLFYEKTASGSNKYCVMGLPCACENCGDLPLSVLIPHYRLSDEKIAFFEFAKFMYQVKLNCCGDFSNVEYDGFVNLPCEHQDIPVIPLHPNVLIGKPGKYLLFMLCRKRHSKPPLTRKSSRIKST